jgi:excinuclease ABC subunit C
MSRLLEHGALSEALTRRCARIVVGEYPPPDLLVMDGGKGQVAVAANVLEEQGLHGVPTIGIAKGPERKAGEEDIVFPDREAVLNLPSDHPGLHLLQQIRDEAHRFAIQGHRARRAKHANQPGPRIGRAAHHLQRLALAGVHRQHLQLVRVRVRCGSKYFRHREAREFLGRILEPLDFDPERI